MNEDLVRKFLESALQAKPGTPEFDYLIEQRSAYCNLASALDGWNAEDKTRYYTMGKLCLCVLFWPLILTLSVVVALVPAIRSKL